MTRTMLRSLLLRSSSLSSSPSPISSSTMLPRLIVMVVIGSCFAPASLVVAAFHQTAGRSCSSTPTRNHHAIHIPQLTNYCGARGCRRRSSRSPSRRIIPSSSSYYYAASSLSTRPSKGARRAGRDAGEAVRRQ